MPDEMKPARSFVSFALALALCLPLFVSCGPRGDDGSGGGNNGGDDTAGIYVPEKDGLTGTLASFNDYPDGDYLADAKFDTDEFLPDYDYDPRFAAGSPIASDGSSVFMAGEREDGCTYIMFLDKKSGAAYPLCGKPECLHDGEDCSAYVCAVPESVVTLSCYDGALYWIQKGSTLRLFRQKKDGTAREEICTLTGNATGSTAFIHRGYAYVTTSVSSVIDGVASASSTLTACPLSGGTASRILKSEGVPIVKPLGNDIYIMLYDLKGRDLSNYIWGKELLELYRWDTKKRRAELLAVDTNEELGMGIETQDMLPVAGDGIYFQSMTEYKDESGTWRDKAAVRKYSFASGELEVTCPQLIGDGCSNFMWVNFFSGHIVSRGFSEEKEMRLSYIFGTDGRFVSSHDVEGAFRAAEGTMAAYKIVGADEENVYYFCENRSGSGASSKTLEAFFLAVPIAAGSHDDGVRVDFIGS